MARPETERNVSSAPPPPSSVATAFFLTGPPAVIAAGAIMALAGMAALQSNWTPMSLGLTHLGTLGFLVMILMGTVYRAGPRLLGRPVPSPRLGHAVHGLVLVGTGTLVWGLAGRVVPAVFTSISALALALLLFLVPSARAVRSAPKRDDAVRCTGIALASFLLAGLLGLWMAHGHSGMRFPGPRGLFIQVHLTFALLGWVGGLLAALSWRLLPELYDCDPSGRVAMRAVVAGLAAGVLLTLAVLVLDTVAGPLGPRRAPTLAAAGALPAALMIWGVHPVSALRAMFRTMHPRTDGSFLLWQAGLLLGPVVGLVALTTSLAYVHPRWLILLGWLAIWGWAGMIAHGVLLQIGRAPDPPAPAGEIQGRAQRIPSPLGFGLHIAALVSGAAAILGDLDSLARITGILLIGTGVHMGLWLLGARSGSPRAARMSP